MKRRRRKWGEDEEEVPGSLDKKRGKKVPSFIKQKVESFPAQAKKI
jgi:hypothetical protein